MSHMIFLDCLDGDSRTYGQQIFLNIAMIVSLQMCPEGTLVSTMDGEVVRVIGTPAQLMRRMLDAIVTT